MKFPIALIIILSVLLTFSSYAQRKSKTLPEGPPPPPTEEEARQITYNQACVYYEKYSTKVRRRFYPYRRADSVFLISFDKTRYVGKDLTIIRVTRFLFTTRDFIEIKLIR